MVDKEQTLPTIKLTHQRVTSLNMQRGEIEALIIAEVIRRAAVKGIVIDLNKGAGTSAEVTWGNIFPVTVEITEDMTLDPSP